MPLPQKVKKKAFIYPEGKAFNCPSCDEWVIEDEPRYWLPDYNPKTYCGVCGRELVVSDDLIEIQK